MHGSNPRHFLLQVKCESYWPKTEMKKIVKGMYNIQMLSQKEYSNFMIRQLEITNKEVQRIFLKTGLRTVNQAQYNKVFVSVNSLLWFKMNYLWNFTGMFKKPELLRLGRNWQTKNILMFIAFEMSFYRELRQFYLSLHYGSSVLKDWRI